MSVELFMGQIWENTVASLGGEVLACLFFMTIIFVGLLFCSLEFDYALVIISPIPYAFYKAGYLDVWIASLFIIIPLGIGIWSIWIKFSNKQ